MNLAHLGKYLVGKLPRAHQTLAQQTHEYIHGYDHYERINLN